MNAGFAFLIRCNGPRPNLSAYDRRYVAPMSSSVSARLQDALRGEEEESTPPAPMSYADMPQATSARGRNRRAANTPPIAAATPAAAPAAAAAPKAATARKSARAAAAEAVKSAVYEHDPAFHSSDEQAETLKLPPFDPSTSADIPGAWKSSAGKNIVKVNVVNIDPLRNDKCLYNALATVFRKFTSAGNGQVSWVAKQIEIGLKKANSVERPEELDVNVAEIRESEEYAKQAPQKLTWPDGQRTKGLKAAYINL